jgi:hypothetical protein
MHLSTSAKAACCLIGWRPPGEDNGRRRLICDRTDIEYVHDVITT